MPSDSDPPVRAGGPGERARAGSWIQPAGPPAPPDVTGGLPGRTSATGSPVIELIAKAPEVRHHPALLTFAELGAVLRRAETSKLSAAVRLAHRLIAFTAVRISNAVEARRVHFDLDAEVPMWVIPRGEMKVSQGRAHAHRVVLPAQIVADLRRWRDVCPKGAVFVFQGNQGRAHLSREAVEKALRVTLGLDGKHSPHGWRAAFSTRVREDTDHDRELIDLCLDHIHASETARAYDRGDRLAKRAVLMKWWGDRSLQAERGSDVVPFVAAAESVPGDPSSDAKLPGSTVT